MKPGFNYIFEIYTFSDFDTYVDRVSALHRDEAQVHRPHLVKQ
jgi:hypothetical protein